MSAERSGPKGRNDMPDNDLAGEIRQALEGVTPDGVEMMVFVHESIFGPTAEIEMSDADRALIAAAPDLLARAADRIEELEQIWLRDLASALDRLAAAQLATAATTCIRCAAVLPDHEDDCTVVLARSILGDAKEGA